MKEQDLMKANNIAGTPDTPDIPLIELKLEKEDIPDEVLHNKENDCKKEEETITEIKHFKRPKDYTTLKKVIKIVFMVFMIINNFSPIGIIILEIVLRGVNNYEFNFWCVYELIIYFGFLVKFINDYCRFNIIECKKIIAWTAYIELFIFLPEIILYFYDDTYASEGFMESFIKFKIISFFAVMVNNIILIIITKYIRD